MQENTIKSRFFIPNNDKNCTLSKKVRIETYGCQMNVADSEVVAAMMEMAGYETTENDTEAAAVLLNTCSIRDNAEQKIYSRIAYWNSMRRKLGRNIIIGVIGCMAERLKQELIDRHGVDTPVLMHILTSRTLWRRRKPARRQSTSTSLLPRHTATSFPDVSAQTVSRDSSR